MNSGCLFMPYYKLPNSITLNADSTDGTYNIIGNPCTCPVAFDTTLECKVAFVCFDV